MNAIKMKHLQQIKAAFDSVNRRFLYLKSFLIRERLNISLTLKNIFLEACSAVDGVHLAENLVPLQRNIRDLES